MGGGDAGGGLMEVDADEGRCTMAETGGMMGRSLCPEAVGLRRSPTFFSSFPDILSSPVGSASSEKREMAVDVAVLHVGTSRLGGPASFLLLGIAVAGGIECLFLQTRRGRWK
jgi:hypothetical protein